MNYLISFIIIIIIIIKKLLRKTHQDEKLRSKVLKMNKITKYISIFGNETILHHHHHHHYYYYHYYYYYHHYYYHFLTHSNDTRDWGVWQRERGRERERESKCVTWSQFHRCLDRYRCVCVYILINFYKHVYLVPFLLQFRL